MGLNNKKNDFLQLNDNIVEYVFAVCFKNKTKTKKTAIFQWR